MKRITKTDLRINRTAYGGLAVALAVLFLAIGAALVLAGLGYLPMPRRIHVPPRVIAVTGSGVIAFALLFALSGLQGILNRRRQRRDQRRYRNQPWFLDYPWDPHGINDEARTRWLRDLTGALFYATLLVPFNWWVFLSRASNVFVQVLMGLFDLILVLWLGAACYHLLQLLKFGRSRLLFERFPFHPGEVIVVRLIPNRAARLNAVLRFVEERFEQRGSGSNRSVSQVSYEHYRDSQELTAIGGGKSLQIRFELPDEAQWVTQLSAAPAVRYWELLLESHEPGINFRTTFPLPVYAVAEGRATRGDTAAAHAVTTRSAPASRSGRDALRRRPSYWFETRVAVVIILLSGAPWLLVPGAVERATRLTDVALFHLRAPHLFERLPTVDPGVEALARSTDGAIWVLSKYGLSRFPHGSTKPSERLLDPSSYRRITGTRIQALSAFAVTGDTEAWVGGWYGQVLHFSKGRWTQIAAASAQPAEAFPRGRIQAVVVNKSFVYFGARNGLWRLPVRGAKALTRDAGIPGRAIVALALDASRRLVAAGRSTVYLHVDHGWRRLWAARREDGFITSLMPQPDGSLVVGTRYGLVTVGALGEQPGRALAGRWIKALTADPRRRLWIATWDAGIGIPNGENSWNFLGKSMGLPLDSVSDLIFGPEGKLWIGGYGVAAVPSAILLNAPAGS